MPPLIPTFASFRSRAIPLTEWHSTMEYMTTFKWNFSGAGRIHTWMVVRGLTTRQLGCLERTSINITRISCFTLLTMVRALSPSLFSDSVLAALFRSHLFPEDLSLRL